jgi:hypothetical protein
MRWFVFAVLAAAVTAQRWCNSEIYLGQHDPFEGMACEPWANSSHNQSRVFWVVTGPDHPKVPCIVIPNCNAGSNQVEIRDLSNGMGRFPGMVGCFACIFHSTP